MLNLVYTVAIICLASLPVLGYIYDHCGTVCVRILSVCLCAGGFFLMALAERGREWLLFPGAVFHLVGGIQLAVTDVQVAVLFPKLKATLICLISGAIDVSGFAPILLKLTYQAGASYKTFMFTFAGVILFLSSVNTFTLPPRQDDDGNNIDIACCFKIRKRQRSKTESSKPNTSTCTNADHVPTANERQSGHQVLEQGLSNAAYMPDDVSTEPKCGVPSIGSATPELASKEKADGDVTREKADDIICQGTSCQHENNTNHTEMRVDGIGQISCRIENSPVSTYTDVYSWFQVGSLIWALLNGLMLDKLVSRATADDKERCFVVPFFITVLAGLIASIACIIPIIEMQFVAILFHSMLKTGSYASHLAYIASTFPKEHFGKTYGIQIGIGFLFTFIEYPIFAWYKYSLESDPFWLGLLFLGICLTASCLPFYLLWRRCRYTRSNSYTL
ncbi:large neutral amino acids transporter small subunit 3-like isoform X2 [Lingula anatina]|uniref:Large neutral amino acids transporter small subunit 3-like isoform X2 n=1 Tax=Lingula anatina TaxID=7574 RepID=A0A1S3HK72_LINAN|nr:large neutral amino acids transporter small subunit 3-like isoform X2 [Lingula anatina]|eukprot:XP_013385856.1 large neutral amino acids transporter small subunit 3-like isoform X2 [Lingula anatina]